MNTWLIVGALLLGWVITSVVLGVVLGKMIRLHMESEKKASIAVNAIHRRCVTRMVEVVDSDHTARVLREAADDWEDPVTQGHMMLLAQRKYRAGGPSMPSIWLNERADRIEEEHR